MDNYLTEFENVNDGKSTLPKWIVILFFVSVLYLLWFTFFPTGLTNYSPRIFQTWDTYISLSILLASIYFLYRFYKRKKIGWLVTVIIVWLLLAVYGVAIYFFFISGRWPAPSITRALITIYFFLHHVTLLFLLYHNQIRKLIKLNTIFVAISLFLGISVFVMVIIAVNSATTLRQG